MKRNGKYGIKDQPNIPPVEASNKINACFIYALRGIVVSYRDVEKLDDQPEKRKTEENSRK